MNDNLECNETIADYLRRPTQAQLEATYTYMSCTQIRAAKQKDMPIEIELQKQKSKESELEKLHNKEHELKDHEILWLYANKKSHDNQAAVVATAGATDSADEESKNVCKKKKKYSYKAKQFEFCVIYKKLNGKIGVRKLKVVRKGDEDVDKNMLKLASMRKKFAKLIVNSGDFDPYVYDKCGRFFNKKFWELNILWGGSESFEENLQATSEFISNFVYQLREA